MGSAEVQGQLPASDEQAWAGFSGRIVAQDDADYDAVRTELVWNGDIDRRPWAIARALSADDVAIAVKLARATGRELAVRGGGHNFSGSCTADDAIMIDLGALSAVSVDPVAATARCGGGTRWAQLDAATQAHGLAVPGGVVSHTGVGGLTLGGGIGWLTRTAGLSCDSLLSAEVVTAGGNVVRASAEENPDLFWALRGGGGNFGVVTEFEFRLHQAGPMVQMSLSLWDLDHGPRAFRALRDQARNIPDDIAILLAAMNAPPAPFVPQEQQGALGYQVLLVGHGSPEALSQAAGDLRREAPPLAAFDTPIPYTALQQMSDSGNPWRIRAYEKAIYLDELTDEAIDVIARHITLKSSPMSFMSLFILGGKYAEPADQDTAFAGSRRTRYVLTITAMAPAPELLEADRAWARAFWADLVPHAGGVGGYVNWMSEFEEDRILASYGAEKYQRLSSIKAKYDPDNLFHLNANIRPAAQPKPRSTD